MKPPLNEEGIEKSLTMLSLLLDMAQTGESRPQHISIISRFVIKCTHSSVMVGNIGLAKIPGVQHGEMTDTSRFYEDWAIVEWEHTGCNHLLEVPLILDDEMRMKLFNTCKINFIS